MSDDATTGTDWDEAFANRQKTEKARKRRLALGIAIAMMVGYGGAIAYGTTANAQPARAPNAVAQPAR